MSRGDHIHDANVPMWFGAADKRTLEDDWRIGRHLITKLCEQSRQQMFCGSALKSARHASLGWHQSSGRCPRTTLTDPRHQDSILSGGEDETFPEQRLRTVVNEAPPKSVIFSGFLVLATHDISCFQKDERHDCNVHPLFSIGPRCAGD